MIGLLLDFNVKHAIHHQMSRSHGHLELLDRLIAGLSGRAV